jgi:tetratricopeptide (TPR) repeat protein
MRWIRHATFGFIGPAVLALGVGAIAAPADGPEEVNEEALGPQAPLPPPGFLKGCLALIEQKQYEQARQLLAPVVADHPGWARAHFYLALTYQKENRYERARELFRRALQLDPQEQSVRLFYGWCLYYLGELAASREMFESFLTVKPEYPDAIFALGLLDFDDDHIDSARRRFLEAITLARQRQDKPTEAKARARLADVLIRTGELGSARDELVRSIELNPDNYETYFKLSRVLERLGDAQGAEAARSDHHRVQQRTRPEKP